MFLKMSLVLKFDLPENNYRHNMRLYLGTQLGTDM
jgi:hypothetical protein